MQTVSESERVAQIEPGGAYTSPLGLVSRLKQGDIKFDLVPVLDLVVIALLVSLVFTLCDVARGSSGSADDRVADAIHRISGCGSYGAEPGNAVF